MTAKVAAVLCFRSTWIQIKRTCTGLRAQVDQRLRRRLLCGLQASHSRGDEPIHVVSRTVMGEQDMHPRRLLGSLIIPILVGVQQCVSSVSVPFPGLPPPLALSPPAGPDFPSTD